MPLPSFLIIGAMKCGTTSLYRDLEANPDVFFPLDKEPGNLASDDVLTGKGRGDYEGLYSRAARGQVCGDASARYAMRPDFPCVPERARRVLGSDVRIIYLVREPLARIVSHHYHDYIRGVVNESIDWAVRRYSRYIDYSRYAEQVEPWIEVFGPHQVEVVKFEHYIANRRRVVAELSTFIGVRPRPDLVNVHRIFNRGDGQPVLTGPWLELRDSGLYQRWVRPRLSTELRHRLRYRLLPEGPPRPEPPSQATRRFLREALSEDVTRQAQVFPPMTRRPLEFDWTG